VRRPLLLLSLPHEFLYRLRHLVDLRGKPAQLTGELSRTSGILRRTHGVNSLSQDVHILGKGHQRNEDRRPSFLKRVKAGIGVRVFAGRLGNQFLNPCSGSHRDSVGTVRIRDGRWSVEYPLIEQTPVAVFVHWRCSCLTLSWVMRRNRETTATSFSSSSSSSVSSSSRVS